MISALLILLAGEPALAVPAAPVRAVRIEAAPADRARLARYVDVPVGQGLDPEAVRHSVDLLFATGAFADVIVETLPAADGLEVVFRPIPAPFCERVVVTGDAVLSAGQVQSLSHLREREPLWDQRIARAGQDVTAALVERGYLNAEVKAQVRRTAAGAEAVFTLTAGPRFRLRAVRLAGVAAGSPIASALAALRPGATFSRQAVQSARDALLRRLRESGYWRAQVESAESVDRAAGEVALSVTVQSGPLYSLEIRGRPVSRAVIREVELLLREGALRSDALEEARERLESALRRQGRRQVIVTYSFGERPGEERVVYTLNATEPQRVASVRLAGVDDKSLAASVSTRAGDLLDESRLEADARAVERALAERGYARARSEIEIPDGRGAVPVELRVEPGVQTVLRELAIEGQASLPESSLKPRLQIGRPYRMTDLARDRDELLSLLRNAGYLQAEVVPEVRLNASGSEARVRLRPVLGPRTLVDHIVVAGLSRTREEVVRRELVIHEGEPWSLDRIAESQRRLATLGLFRQVSLFEMDPEGGDRRSLVVAVDEAPRITWALGVGSAGMGSSDNAVLRMSTEVTRRNLAGLDRSLSTFVRFSFRGSRVLASYREPYLFGRKADLTFTAFREEEQRTSFDFDRFGVTLETARSLGRGWSGIFRYSLSKTISKIRVPLEDVDRQFRNSRFSGPSVSLVSDTRDDPLDPTRGRFFGGDLAFSHAALGGTSFSKAFVQSSAYRRISSTTLLAAGGRLGWAWTFRGQQLADPDRFYAGGHYSLRGFDIDGVRPEGGNGLLVMNLELRNALSRRLSLALFSDAGNVFLRASELSSLELRHSAGVGLRYRSALGPLRLDWAYRLDSRPTDRPARRWTLHATIGHAF